MGVSHNVTIFRIKHDYSPLIVSKKHRRLCIGWQGLSIGTPLDPPLLWLDDTFKISNSKTRNRALLDLKINNVLYTERSSLKKIMPRNLIEIVRS
jgi:hypothetical protein